MIWPEKVAKKCKKAQKFAEMCVKSALFGRNVLKKVVFLYFCARISYFILRDAYCELLRKTKNFWTGFWDLRLSIYYLRFEKA